MSIADKLKDKNAGKGFASAPRTQATAEGGNEMVLAMTTQVQEQANQMVAAAQAADILINHASEQMAEYFTEVLSGRALLNATMAKVQERLDSQGTVTINTDVQPITLDLPAIGTFAETRRKFLGAFGGNRAPDYSKVPSAFLKSSEESDGECD